MPSYRWAVDYFSRMSDDIHHIGSDTTSRNARWRRVQKVGPGDPARSATIRRRRDNREIMQYWVDIEGPQYKTPPSK